MADLNLHVCVHRSHMYALQIHTLRKLTCLCKEKPYFFIKFDRQITKILGRTEADDVWSIVICNLQLTC